MSISVTGRTVERRGGNGFAAESVDQSTATSFATVGILTDAFLLASGTTSSGFHHNVAQMGASDATEGAEKTFIMLASGEFNLFVADSTATGRFVMNSDEDLLHFRFIDGKWRVLQNTGATIATAT